MSGHREQGLPRRRLDLHHDPSARSRCSATRSRGGCADLLEAARIGEDVDRQRRRRLDRQSSRGRRRPARDRARCPRRTARGRGWRTTASRGRSRRASGTAGSARCRVRCRTSSSALPIASRYSSADRSSSSATSSEPRSIVSGVRSSCDTSAMNWCCSFSAAASASSRAFRPGDRARIVLGEIVGGIRSSGRASGLLQPRLVRTSIGEGCSSDGAAAARRTGEHVAQDLTAAPHAGLRRPRGRDTRRRGPSGSASPGRRRRSSCAER